MKLLRASVYYTLIDYTGPSVKSVYCKKGEPQEWKAITDALFSYAITIALFWFIWED